jgi:transcriptional regulator with XRE-family HTH domain
MENKRVDIGVELKKFFKEMGITQQKVANKLGISQAVVAALLNGRPFGKKTAKRWSDEFGLQSTWLLTGEGNMLNNNQTIRDISHSNIVGNSVVGSRNKVVTGNENQITTANLTEILRLQKGYQETIKKKDEQIDKLLSIIEKLSK